MSNNCINIINIIKNCFLSCKKNYFSKKNFEKKDDCINKNNINSDDKIEIVIDNVEENNIRKRNEKNIDEEIKQQEIDEDNFEIIDESELEE